MEAAKKDHFNPLSAFFFPAGSHQVTIQNSAENGKCQRPQVLIKAEDAETHSAEPKRHRQFVTVPLLCYSLCLYISMNELST